MKRFVVLFLVMIALVGNAAHAQRATADSLLQALANTKNDLNRLQTLGLLSEALLKLNADSSLMIAKQLELLATEKQSTFGLIRALRLQGDAIARNGDSDRSIVLYKRALAIPSDMPKDVVYKGFVHRLLGVAYYHQAKYDSALLEMFTALELFKHDSLQRERAGVLNNIGNVHYFTNKQQAIGYYEQSLAIHKRLGNLDGMASQYGNIGLLLISEKDTAKAIEYSLRSLSMYEKLGYKESIATSQINLAHAYREFGNYSLALAYAKKSFNLRRELGDKKGISLSTLIMGIIYKDQGECVTAIPLLEEAVTLVRSLGLRSYEWEALNSLADCYASTGHPEKAAQLYPKVIALKDSIYKDESTEQIAKMEALYQTQKDGKVKLLEQEAEINELQLRKRETYLGAATAITFLLGIMSLMAFFAYRSKAKVNTLLEKKNHLIEEQKKEITDSIRYAENIQRALLPPAEVLRAVFPESFILHRPKDIVSGDFYWIHDLPDRVYFAVVDCTGHGVPGAFMSFIGTSALNRAVTDLQLVLPSDILSSLSDQVSAMLRSGQGADVKDGMDLALCCYFKEKKELHYAGAYNPLWVMRNGEMEIVKADKHPVGNLSSHRPFTDHSIRVAPGDSVYLFSDGFADQFGGKDDKKIGTGKFRSTLVSMNDTPLRDQGAALTDFFDNWKGTAEQVDDVCVMGVRF
jgi:serine phosphatase RsbU (regulator of sigma subunit)